MKLLGKSLIVCILSSCISLAAQDRPSQDGLSICGQFFWLGMSADEVLRKIPDGCRFNKVATIIFVESKRDESSWRVFLEDDKVHDLSKIWRVSGGSEGYDIGKAIADAISGESGIAPIAVSTVPPPARKTPLAEVWIYTYKIPPHSDARTIVISFGNRAVKIDFYSHPKITGGPTGIQIEESIQTQLKEKVR